LASEKKKTWGREKNDVTVLSSSQMKGKGKIEEKKEEERKGGVANSGYISFSIYQKMRKKKKKLQGNGRRKAASGPFSLHDRRKREKGEKKRGR